MRAARPRKRPRKPGIGEVRRYGGPQGAQHALDWHRKRQAEAQRIADRIEQSLALYGAAPIDEIVADAIAAGERQLAAREHKKIKKEHQWWRNRQKPI